MAERRVLLVEPFLVGSHEAWATGWQQHSRHRIEIVGLTDGRWRRGMRAGAVTLAAETLRWIRDNGRPDAVVATNMLDLAGYLGLTRRELASTPAAQFMHENQLSYPRRPGEPLDTGLAWMQWRGLVAADAVWCNSRFHAGELLTGLDELAALDPSAAVDRRTIEAKLDVVHLGIDYDACRRARPAAGRRRPFVVSNQRWHHDKDLGSVLRALRTAADRGFEFDVALLGDDRGGEAETLAPLVDALGTRVVERGPVSRQAYLEILQRADIVVSAARNENFGIAVAEAIAAGAWPVCPAELAYPEVVPETFHADCLYEPGGLGARLRDVIGRVSDGESSPAGLAASMARFAWPRAAAALDDHVDALLARGATV